jgi:hypothetical protein
MAIDIITIDPSKRINDKYAVCSVLPTGSYSKLLVRENYPVDLTIASIENKFDNRFDNPSYYYGGGGGADGGDVGEDGDVLGV